jgi:hypothetical protein
MKSNRPMTATQWIARAARHQGWRAAWKIELEAFKDQLGEAPDMEAALRMSDRVQVVMQRIEQLQRIMMRHFERAPTEILPELISAFRHKLN